MEQLCRKIDLPEEVTQAVLAWQNDPDFSPDLAPITREETWVTGLNVLKETLGEDPQGFKLLCCMLRCALAAQDTYRKLGFSQSIYYDTMACFSRFVREHRESYGFYTFDRGSWTVRQISCKLFRIGQLEYELVTRERNPMISLHIPSDALLQEDRLRQSYLQARQVIGSAFPEYADAPMYCVSWLLSPALTQLLKPDSRILAFQRLFDITPIPAENMQFLQWIVKKPNLPPEEFPEDTSLQRNLKAFLLKGGSFPIGKGILRP